MFAETVAIVAATVALTAVGCGPSTDKLPISGTVTLDGTPLDNGSIRFSSTGGAMASTGALIRDGQYQIDAEKGLLPGTYLVEITSPDNNAKPIMYRTGSDDPGSLTQPERIPPEYNIESKQLVEIAADKENHFAFDIVGKPTD